MTRRSSRPLVAAGAVATYLVGLFGVSAAGATTPRAAPTAILTCQSKAVVRPSSFVIACADANSYLQRIKWTSWGAASASANAVYTANNCTPYCAAGKFINYSARVTLSLPKTTKRGRLFTHLHVSYRSGTKWVPFNFSLLD